jgi:hypothetical protein
MPGVPIAAALWVVLLLWQLQQLLQAQLPCLVLSTAGAVLASCLAHVHLFKGG